MKRYIFSLLIVCFCFALLVANDGRDRYAKGSVTYMALFPEPACEEAGYRILPSDTGNGADGSREFHWARPWAINFLRLCAFEVRKEMGPCKLPMAVFDLCAENGDTPVEFKAAEGPDPRHPGNSHDGGVNMDFSYYLTSEEGAEETPDYAACTKHYHETEKTKEDKPKDMYMCTGPADRLDAERQAYFFIRMFSLDKQLFDGRLLGPIGMDWKVQEAVMAVLETWLKEETHGVSRELIDRMQDIFTADRFGGWARFHHHHFHLRLNDLKYRDCPQGFEALGKKARELDEFLAMQTQEEGKPYLLYGVFSYNLSRSFEVELVGDIAAKDTRFRLDEGEWVAADTASWSKVRAVLDLPALPLYHARTYTITAETTLEDGSTYTCSKVVQLPCQPPYLHAAFEPEQIVPRVVQAGHDWSISLDVPQQARVLLTAVKYTVYRGTDDDVTKETYTSEPPAYAVNFTDWQDTEDEDDKQLKGRVNLITVTYSLCYAGHVRRTLYCLPATELPPVEDTEE